MTERQKKIRSVFFASSGNLVEWYDFYIYAFSATYFANEFSTSSNQTIAFIQAFGIFALGFLMRPFGSWIFGAMADKVGRKSSMIISVCIMALGSFMIAILPTKTSVGDWAIIWLLIARLIQGASVGGEYGIAATYLSELATPGRRGFYASFQYVTLIGGQMLAVLSIVILEHLMPASDIKTYGWRILFAIGGVLALASLFLRFALVESATKESLSKKERGSIKELFSKNLRSFLIVVGFTAAGSLSFYTFSVYTKIFLINTVKMAQNTSSNIMLFALFIFMLIQPLFGALGDKIGRVKMLQIWAVLGIFCTYACFKVMEIYKTPYIAFAAIMILLIILSFYTSVAGIVKAQLFPMHVRALGTGLAYAVGNACFGGTASVVALKLKEIGSENVFFIYIAVMFIIAFIVTFLIPKTTDLS